MSESSRLTEPPAAATGATAADVAALCARIDAFVGGASAWQALVAERDALLRRTAAIGSQREAATGPLRVLLLGGTGAGKSTLLNALAGAEVARASAARPTTTEVTCYHHRDTAIDTLGAAVLRGAHRQTHTHAPLRDKIILDAPDFDSNLIENREVLGRALQVADLVLTVATTEKYLTRELFRLLAAHRDRFRRTSFVFVLNKSDLGVAPEVIDDFATELAGAGFPEARILALSARTALEARLGAPDADMPVPAAGQFDELRRLLEDELDRVRIQAIKSGNLAASLTAFTARIAELLPDHAAQHVADWEAECASAERDFCDDVAGRLLAALEGDREARNLAALTLGSSFSWLYGMASGLVYAVRCAIRPDFRRLRGAGAEAARDLLRGSAMARGGAAPAGEEVELVLRAQVHAAARHGLAPAAVAAAGADARRPEVAQGLMAGVEEWLARRIDEAFTTAAAGRVHQMMDLAANLPPLIFTLWTVWRLAAGYLSAAPGALLGLDFITASAALLGALLALEFVLVDRWYVAGAADRCFAAVAGLLRREAERDIGARLLEGVQAVAAQARTEAATVAELAAEAERIAAGATD